MMKYILKHILAARYAMLTVLVALALGCTGDIELHNMRARMQAHDYNCRLAQNVYRRALEQGRQEYTKRASEIAAELGCPIQ